MHYPPSYISSSEHLALKRKIREFEESDFVITVPLGAYRCPLYFGIVGYVPNVVIKEVNPVK